VPSPHAAAFAPSTNGNSDADHSLPLKGFSLPIDIERWIEGQLAERAVLVLQKNEGAEVLGVFLARKDFELLMSAANLARSPNLYQRVWNYNAIAERQVSTKHFAGF
jgi:hypothetical protein